MQCWVVAEVRMRKNFYAAEYLLGRFVHQIGIGRWKRHVGICLQNPRRVNSALLDQSKGQVGANFARQSYSLFGIESPRSGDTINDDDIGIACRCDLVVKILGSLQGLWGGILRRVDHQNQ